MKKQVKKIMRPLALIGLMLGGVIISSCTTTKNTLNTAKSLSSVYVTNTNKIKILTPEYMAGEIDSLYVFSADLGGQSLSCLSYFFANSEEMSLVLLSDFGLEIGNLHYDGENLDSKLPVEAKIKGEYIVADLENIFYPEQYLSENYNASGLLFESKAEDGGSITRTISKDGKTIEKITMTLTEDGLPDEVELENSLRGYSYKLKYTEE